MPDGPFTAGGAGLVAVQHDGMCSSPARARLTRASGRHPTDWPGTLLHKIAADLPTRPGAGRAGAVPVRLASPGE